MGKIELAFPPRGPGAAGRCCGADGKVLEVDAAALLAPAAAGGGQEVGFPIFSSSRETM